MPRRKRNRKWLKWIIILMLIAVAGVVWYFVWDGYFREKPKGDAGNDNVSTVIEDTKEKEVIDTPGVTEEEKQEVASKMEQYAEKPEAEEYSGVINYAAVNGDKLMVRVNIDQYAGSGTCELTLKQNSNELYWTTANIVDVVSTATCEGFDVPLAEIGVTGDIDIIVKISADGKGGTISGKARV